METTIILLAIILLVVWFPKWGLFFLIRNFLAAQEREKTEHVLKHILDRQYLDQNTNLSNLSSLSGTSRKETTRLVKKMESQNLLVIDGENLSLTPQGEKWGIHVMRAHRLWERYLADEARMPLKNVHTEAHRLEHKFSEEQVNNMEIALGYPTHDPHGDPIPNRSGKITTNKYSPLTDWPLNKAAQIIRLEDEPAIAYQQILASGLTLGRHIRVLENNAERVIVSDGENEYRFAPLVAANILVRVIQNDDAPAVSLTTLNEMGHLQAAEIVMLDDAVQGFTRRRFMDLGLTPGTLITPELQNFFGDPRAYRVRGTLIALRKDQAAQILVKPV